jgi:hypothetical protein
MLAALAMINHRRGQSIQPFLHRHAEHEYLAATAFVFRRANTKSDQGTNREMVARLTLQLCANSCNGAPLRARGPCAP